MGMIHLLRESVIFHKEDTHCKIIGVKPSVSKPTVTDKWYLQLNAFKNVCRKLLRKFFLACKFSVIPAEGSLSSRKLGVLKE